MGKLEGKIAVITGGSSIIGRQEAELSAAIEEIGRNVTSVQGDVSKLGDLDRLFDRSQQTKGRLDIVFANAAISKYAPLGAITIAKTPKS